MKYLLAVDVGNSCIGMAVYDWESLDIKRCFHGRFPTRPAARYHQENVRWMDRWGVSPSEIVASVVSSVVPSVHGAVDEWLKTLCPAPVFWITHQVISGLTIEIEHPETLGPDRLVNAAWGAEKLGAPLVIADLGTATTLDLILPPRRFVGGVITPGFHSFSEGLWQEVPHLPRVNIPSTPPPLVGSHTVAALQSGLVYGYAGVVDGILTRLQNEYSHPHVVLTGGLAEIFAPHLSLSCTTDPFFTLDGLAWLYRSNHRE